MGLWTEIASLSVVESAHFHPPPWRNYSPHPRIVVLLGTEITIKCHSLWMDGSSSCYAKPEKIFSPWKSLGATPAISIQIRGRLGRKESDQQGGGVREEEGRPEKSHTTDQRNQVIKTMTTETTHGLNPLLNEGDTQWWCGVW